VIQNSRLEVSSTQEKFAEVRDHADLNSYVTKKICKTIIFCKRN